MSPDETPKEQKKAAKAQEKAAKKQAKADNKAAKSQDRTAKEGDTPKESRGEKYQHLRADVPRRRKAYGWFIVLAILVFVVSLVDILFLENALFWGVIAAYAVLLVWGIFLLFSRRGEERVRQATVTDRDYLRCGTCRHVFAFDMQHLHDPRKPVVFTCPECGTPGRLPNTEKGAAPAAIPGGGTFGPRFLCDNCGERWSVAALGHDPKSDVHFQACPHCGSEEDMRKVVEDKPSGPRGSAA